LSKEVSAYPGSGWALFLCLGGRFALSSPLRRGLQISGFGYRLGPGSALSVYRSPHLGCPFGLIQRGAKIKAEKKSATCAASPRKSSKLAPSLRSVAQTAKIFVRSDPAPVEPPISSRPVVAGSVGEAENPLRELGPHRAVNDQIGIQAGGHRLAMRVASPSETPHRERPGMRRWPGRSIDWSSTISRALSPLPGEGMSRTPIREQTGWVDGQRDLRLVLATIYPSFYPLSRGETWGQAACFAIGGPAESAVTIPYRLCPQPNDSRSTAHDSRPTAARITIHNSRFTTHASPSSERSKRTILHPPFSILHPPAKATHR
jgi:hypothetical protein